MFGNGSSKCHDFSSLSSFQFGLKQFSLVWHAWVLASKFKIFILKNKFRLLISSKKRVANLEESTIDLLKLWAGPKWLFNAFTSQEMVLVVLPVFFVACSLRTLTNLSLFYFDFFMTHQRDSKFVFITFPPTFQIHLRLLSFCPIFSGGKDFETNGNKTILASIPPSWIQNW